MAKKSNNGTNMALLMALLFLFATILAPIYGDLYRQDLALWALVSAASVLIVYICYSKLWAIRRK